MYMGKEKYQANAFNRAYWQESDTSEVHEIAEINQDFTQVFKTIEYLLAFQCSLESYSLGL